MGLFTELSTESVDNSKKMISNNALSMKVRVSSKKTHQTNSIGAHFFYRQSLAETGSFPSSAPILRIC